MTVKGHNENGILTVYLEGHIDSANAGQAEQEIQNLISKQSVSELILDCEALSYISSAGLRIILRLKKTIKAFKLIHVSSEVYEIFDMTGFTEMMDISKAYRRLSIDGCEAIGQGSNGVVYRLDADTIIKVYRNPDCLPDIQRERELARKALILGIPTAIPYDVVSVNNTYGSVFELLNAKSFSKIVAAEPEKLEETVDEFVKLLKQIHATEIKPGDMPEMKGVAVKWAKDLSDVLPQDISEKLITLIQAVPERSTMLHGDYHFKNVMKQNGEVLLIDMDTLCVGHPVFEFASIYLANVGFGEIAPEKSEKFLGLPRATTLKIWDLTLRKYFETDNTDKINQYADKARIIGYTRLLRRTIRREPDDIQLINHCKENLIALVRKTDTLEF